MRVDKIFSLVVSHHRQNLWSVFLVCPPSHSSFSVARPVFLTFALLPSAFHNLLFQNLRFSFVFFFLFDVFLLFLQLTVIRAWGESCSVFYPSWKHPEFPQCLAGLCMERHRMQWNWFQRVKFSHKPFTTVSQISGRSYFNICFPAWASQDWLL